MRLHKRTCSSEPPLITSVIRTSRAWYQLIWGSEQVDFLLDKKEHKHSSAFRVARGLGEDMTQKL